MFALHSLTVGMARARRVSDIPMRTPVLHLIRDTAQLSRVVPDCL
jgi:hypothetical protein